MLTFVCFYCAVVKIAEEIVAAAARGVVVRVISDGTKDFRLKDSKATWLGRHKGVEVRLSPRLEVFHPKVVIADGAMRMSGASAPLISTCGQGR